MAIISNTAHERLMKQLKTYISENEVVGNGLAGLLAADADHLQTIVDKYQKNILQLRELITEYQAVQHRVRKNMRKLQLTK